MTLSDLWFVNLRWPIFPETQHNAKQQSKLMLELLYIYTRLHQEMRYPNVTWRIIFSVYLFTTELRHTCRPTSRIFSLSKPNDNCYISNGGLRKAPCVSCYCPLPVFLAWIMFLPLPIQTRNSANAEHTASWRIKCCTNVQRIALKKNLQPVNDLQSHSRSLPLLPFDRSYTISY